MWADIFRKLDQHGITLKSYPSLCEAIMEVCEKVAKDERDACIDIVMEMDDKDEIIQAIRNRE